MNAYTGLGPGAIAGITVGVAGAAIVAAAVVAVILVNNKRHIHPDAVLVNERGTNPPRMIGSL